MVRDHLDDFIDELEQFEEDMACERRGATFIKDIILKS